MTGFGYGMEMDPEIFADRLTRYLQGDKEAVKQEVADERDGPSSDWDDAEFQAFLSDDG